MWAAWWAGRSLRTKLLLIVALAFLPVITVSAAYTFAGERAIASWAVLVVATAALVIALLAVSFGADRWCIRPLRYIEDIAGRIVRGEAVEIALQRPQTLELGLMANGVAAMASALAKREADLRAGLDQRDHLLRELQHRVKNNLQMIMSLINLQAGEIRSPRIRRLFRDAQHRVLTLSILHVHLYERSNWSLVDFQEFIGDVVRQVTLSRQDIKGPALRYHIRASSLTAGPDIAIPVGLIVTEAVNAILDSSSSDIATPEIDIDMAEKSGIVELTIADNAPSPRNAPKPERLRTFGMTLIRGLAMQLAGELHLSNGDEGGLRFAVIFPMPTPSEGAAA
jgi:two-component sensor histidine kinase